VPEGSCVAEGRRVVRPKSNVPKKPYREGLSRLGFRRRYRRSRSVGALSGEGSGVLTCSKRWCASRAKESGVPRRQKWGDGPVKDVDAATQNRGKNKKE
jgi:hypothetical protein